MGFSFFKTFTSTVLFLTAVALILGVGGLFLLDAVRNPPIVFYGRAVDQDGGPVSGATVMGSISFQKSFFELGFVRCEAVPMPRDFFP